MALTGAGSLSPDVRAKVKFGASLHTAFPQVRSPGNYLKKIQTQYHPSFPVPLEAPQQQGTLGTWRYAKGLSCVLLPSI